MNAPRLFFLSSLLFVSVANANDRITVAGKVVDNETGKPITAMMIQAGKMDPKDPKKITWGFSERNTRAKTGRFSTTVRWNQGWTARIVADGYEPHPILTEAPELGQTKLEVEIRLKKGKPIAGVVLDHTGKPVPKAKVYAVSARGINLTHGQARDRYDEKVDIRAKFVETDNQGKFEIHVGGSTSIAVCAPTIDAWAHAVDATNSKALEIKLPAPTLVRIRCDIARAGDEVEVFYQFLSYLSEGYKNIQSTRSFKMKNGESIDLKTLPPGKYQFVRQKMHHFGSVGIGAMLDRTFVEIKAGETTEINFARPKGQRLSGLVKLPKDANLAGVILSVKAVEAEPQPWSKHKNHVVYSSQLIAGMPQKTIEESKAAFKTELLSPGKYIIQVVGYKRMTPAEMRLSGIRLPEFESVTKELTVTEAGAPNMMVIELKPRK